MAWYGITSLLIHWRRRSVLNLYVLNNRKGGIRDNAYFSKFVVQHVHGDCRLTRFRLDLCQLILLADLSLAVIRLLYSIRVHSVNSVPHSSAPPTSMKGNWHWCQPAPLRSWPSWQLATSFRNMRLEVVSRLTEPRNACHGPSVGLSQPFRELLHISWPSSGF